MFLNISNHPCDNWAKDQQIAALQISQQLNPDTPPDNPKVAISDLPFPNIDPHDSDTNIALLADSFANNIYATYQAHTTAIHIMGEMTFTHALVNRLQQRGFLCLAATSQRNTINNPDGSKTVVFKFVQFRPYSTNSNIIKQ